MTATAGLNASKFSGRLPRVAGWTKSGMAAPAHGVSISAAACAKNAGVVFAGPGRASLDDRLGRSRGAIISPADSAEAIRPR